MMREGGGKWASLPGLIASLGLSWTNPFSVLIHIDMQSYIYRCNLFVHLELSTSYPLVRSKLVDNPLLYDKVWCYNLGGVKWGKVVNGVVGW